MYILGHAHLSRALRSVDRDYAVGEGAPALMLPDHADCHKFAYTRAWTDARDVVGKLVRSHVAGDWWLHFDGDLSAPARRRGWVYRRMPVVAHRYEPFYLRAFELGLRSSPEPNDSRRGWAHSMVEYSIDTYLARSGLLDQEFEGLKRELSQLTTRPDALRALWARQGVDPWSQESWTRASVYALRVALSESPEDFAVYGATGKFGLDYSPQSRELVLETQDWILRQIGSDEYETVLRELHDFVARVEDEDLAPAVPGPPAQAPGSDSAA